VGSEHTLPFALLTRISAFVGMGVMILLFPLPGYVAKLVQRASVLSALRGFSMHTYFSGPTATLKEDGFSGPNCHRK
jgi:hypothetical protein